MGKSPEIREDSIDPIIEPLLDRAVRIAARHRLFDRVGLDDKQERSFASLALAERLARGNIYSEDSFLRDPRMEAIGGIPPFNLMRSIMQNWRDRDQKALRVITDREEQAKQFLSDDEDKKRRLSAIERAINDLSARVYYKMDPFGHPRFIPTEEVLDSWARRWQGELSSEK